MSMMGGIMNLMSSNIQAQTAKKGARAGLEEQDTMHSEIMAALAQYSQIGEDSIPIYRALLGIGADGEYDPELASRTLQNRPGFQEGLKTGQNLIETSAAANSNLFSGKAGKDLYRFGVDYSTKNFNETVSRFASNIEFGANITGQANEYRARIGDIRQDYRHNITNIKNKNTENSFNAFGEMASGGASGSFV